MPQDDGSEKIADLSYKAARQQSNAYKHIFTQWMHLGSEEDPLYYDTREAMIDVDQKLWLLSSKKKSLSQEEVKGLLSEINESLATFKDLLLQGIDQVLKAFNEEEAQIYLSSIQTEETELLDVVETLTYRHDAMQDLTSAVDRAGINTNNLKEGLNALDHIITQADDLHHDLSSQKTQDPLDHAIKELKHALWILNQTRTGPYVQQALIDVNTQCEKLSFLLDQLTKDPLQHPPFLALEQTKKNERYAILSVGKTSVGNIEQKIKNAYKTLEDTDDILQERLQLLKKQHQVDLKDQLSDLRVESPNTVVHETPENNAKTKP